MRRKTKSKDLLLLLGMKTFSLTFFTFCWLKQVTGQPTFTVLTHFSRIQLFVTLWTVARQASLSMGFSRQEYWSGLPCPPPGGLPHPGIEPASLMSPALAGGFFTTSSTWEALNSLFKWGLL